MEALDLEALVRAVLIGLSVSLIARYIVHIVTRTQPKQPESRRLRMLAIVALGVLVTLGTYYTWPSLATVPLLDNLAQAEAENLLASRKLVPQPTPQQGVDVEAGRVVPHSQSPVAGLRVRGGTVVSFGVSISRTITPASDHNGTPAGAPKASLFQPASGQKLPCSIGGDGQSRCAVKGTSSGVQGSRFHLLLWLRPVTPPSDQPGWYLERSGNGINSIQADGSWTGIAQIGNAQYPPHQNDVVDIAVSIVDDSIFSELMGRQGVVVEPQPIGSSSDVASSVVVTLR